MVKLVENTEETVHAKKLLDELRSEVREALSGFEQIGDDELYDCIEQAVAGVAERQYLPLGQRIDLKNRLFDSFRRLDILQELVDDPEVTEIMVNGKDHIFVERSGRLERWDRSFEQVEQLEDMIQQIVSKINRVVNVSRPIADARLVEDGSRVHIVLPPIALDGPVVTIRKFPEPITIDRLIRYGSLTREAADFLEKLVRSGYNIFISGGTGSGKTTFLNALSAYIPETERVITIEDSAELQITQIPNLVRLETRGANAEGEGAVEISDLIRASDCRGGARKGMPGYAAGTEYRTFWPVHRTWKQCKRYAVAPGNHDAHGSRYSSDCGAGADCLCNRYSGASRQAEGQKPAGAGNYGSNRIRGGRDSVKSALPV